MTQLLPIRFQEHLQVRLPLPPWTPRVPSSAFTTSAFLSEHRTFSLPPHLVLSHLDLSLPLLLVFLSFACVHPSMYRRITLAPVSLKRKCNISGLTLLWQLQRLSLPLPSFPISRARWDPMTLHTRFCRLASRSPHDRFRDQVIRMELNAIPRVERTHCVRSRDVSPPFLFPTETLSSSAYAPRFRFYPKLLHTLSAYNPLIVPMRHRRVSRKMLSLLPTCST